MKPKEELSMTATCNIGPNCTMPVIRSLSDFTEPVVDADDPDCLFRGRWLNKGNCGLLISTSGIGKSSFTTQAAVHWGMGEAMLGICPTRPLRTLIVQAEDDEYDIVSFRSGTRIGLSTELNRDFRMVEEAEKNVLVGTISGLTDDDFFSWLADAIRACRPDLVIINPLHAFFGGNLNESQACSTFLRQGLDPILKAPATKCAALIVHHTGKPKESSGSILASYIGNGSAELTNYPRSILAIRPHKEQEGFFELVGAKHGDRLGWRDSGGHLTTRKKICYANRLPRYADKCQVIYWVEATPEEMALISTQQNQAVGDGSLASPQSPKLIKKSNDKGQDENALVLVKHVKSNPSSTITNALLRKFATTQWMTPVARNAVKEFEKIRGNHGIGKDSGYYTHSAQDEKQAV